MSILGLECVFQYNDNYLTGDDEKHIPNTNTPTWKEVKLIKDVNVAMTRNVTDVSVRKGQGWRRYKDVLADAVITFQMIFDPNDSAYSYFSQAWWQRKYVDLQALDGPNPPLGPPDGRLLSQGLRAVYVISNFSQPQPLEGVLVWDMEFRLSDIDFTPKWEQYSQ